MINMAKKKRIKKRKEMAGKREETIERRKGFIGGFIDAIWDFLNVLKEMEIQGKQESFEAGEMPGPAGSRIGYQYRVRILGLRKGPTIPGIRQTRAKKSIKPEQKKPLIDVFDHGRYISVIVSLPLVKKENLEFKIVGNVLKITVKTPKGEFDKDIPIPKASQVKKIEKVSFKNGILEIKLKKRGGGK